MIEYISINNYRIIESISFSLSRLNVIIGPNGCGKSTILEAIDQTLFLKENHQNINSESINFYKKSNIEIRSLSPNSSGTIVRDGNKIESRNETFNFFEDHTYPQPLLLKLEMKGMKNSVRFDVDTSSLMTDGSNLAAVIADFRLSDNSVLEKIRSQLSQIVPSIVDIKVHRPKSSGLFELRFDTISAKNIEAKHMSEGTLFALALLVALNSNEKQDKILLIDDLDQGLHPLAQKELMNVLRGILVTNECLQILATSHSPFLLACMLPEEVICMSLDNDGKTKISPLIQHPDFDRWKDEMNPGEFWSLFGDEWVAKEVKA